MPVSRFTDSQKIDIVASHQQKESMRSIGRRLGTSHKPIIAVLREHGVPPVAWRVSGVKVPSGQRKVIAERYTDGESANSIAKDVGCCPLTVAKILAENGIAARDISAATRRLQLDESVFDNPSAEGRYWIGYLMADGCVHKDKRHDSWSISLVQTATDSAHVERFREFLGSGATISTRPASQPRMMPGGYVSVSKPPVHFSVVSKRLAEALIRYGVTPRKSKTAKVIGLESCPHFWRGAIEGDGIVTWHKNPSRPLPLIGLYGSLSLVRQFETFAKSVAPGIKAVPAPASRGSISGLRMVGKPIIPLIRALYDNAAVSLDRKWTVARLILAQDWSDPAPKTCEVSGCDRPHAACGVCKMHHRRLKKHGSPYIRMRVRGPC